MYGFAMKVYGCQMNQYDASKIQTALTALGWHETDEETADAVIFVACSIRDKAEHKVWSELGRYAERWQAEGKPAVAVTSCIAQNVGTEMAGRFPWVRVVSGPRHIGDLPAALSDALDNGNRHTLLDDDPRAVRELDVPPSVRSFQWKASVTISHGCDNFCTYCIGPYVRGRFASRPAEEILAEVRSLVAGGAKEITLLGQNVDTWGLDCPGGMRFADLLELVAREPGVEWLRFMTSYPTDFTVDVVETMVRHSNICPSINLPIQAGSERVLRAMNRRYSLEEYADTMKLIRDGLPEVGLTSDLIVGFPGETEEEFQCSLAALERFRFDMVHTAAYSPRQGTPAAKMKNQIPAAVKERRLNEVNDLQTSIARQINQSLVGRTYKVLVDGPAPKGDYMEARTATDKVVLLKGAGASFGQFVTAKIDSAESWCLKGTVLR